MIQLMSRDQLPATVNVAVHSWVIREQQTIAMLELPLRGTAIFHLRAGSLTTVINGRRQTRQTGEFFTVRAGVPVGVETGGDTAILETVIVAD
jgi:hypothetical protein